MLQLAAGADRTHSAPPNFAGIAVGHLPFALSPTSPADTDSRNACIRSLGVSGTGRPFTRCDRKPSFVILRRIANSLRFSCLPIAVGRSPLFSMMRSFARRQESTLGWRPAVFLRLFDNPADRKWASVQLGALTIDLSSTQQPSMQSHAFFAGQPPAFYRSGPVPRLANCRSKGVSGVGLLGPASS